MTTAGTKNSALDLGAIRACLAASNGRMFWKSLEELADTDALKEFVEHEFPYLAKPFIHDMNRREFLKLMGASLALAGLAACSGPPPEKILPYVQGPEGVVPGQGLYFATAMTRDGFAEGVLAKSVMGRPIKMEGNPLHPANLGGTDVFLQSSVLQLWDPDRSQSVLRGNNISTWDSFLAELYDRLSVFGRSQGEGLRVLTGTVTSPTLAAQLQALLVKYPRARWHQYQPVSRDSVYEGCRLAFGEPLEPRYQFDKAAVILSLDSDFLARPPGHLRYARDFSDRRRVAIAEDMMNRLYVIESTPTIAGAMADHRLMLRAGAIEGAARVIAQRLNVAIPQSNVQPSIADAWLTALMHDLGAQRGASIVIAGENQPPLVHALTHAMNEALGNIGKTVIYSTPVVANPANQTDSLRALTRDMAAGHVRALVILGENPVYAAPADLQFAEHLSKVDLTIHHDLYDDETAQVCHWHIPSTHELEAWSDARAFDGTVTIMQPLIAPLYQNRSPHELMAALLGHPTLTSYDVVRQYWQSQMHAPDFEAFWSNALHDGLIKGSELPTRTVSIQPDFARNLPTQQETAAQGMELMFTPDPTVWDGRFANVGWLQGLPKPLTKLTWDNAALVSPLAAEKMGLTNGDMVELVVQGRTVKAPVWIIPGHPDGAVSVSFGYGRPRAGKIGSTLGFNAYALRTSAAPWFVGGLMIRKTGARYALATTQHHHGMVGRPIARAATLEEFRANPRFVHEDEQPIPSLYPEYKYEGYAWAMTVDLTTCIGCNACITACQAENNIPVVDKEQVMMGREMLWLRVDRYYSGGLDNPRTYFQPVPCMQCEHAPCELVCPVEASIHDSEGINVQVYNRCVGTRFCSNNCPYKVRRFNFLQYSDNTSSIQAQKNPEVTVRMRGVMEKCNYCLQRIANARIAAEIEGRRIRDGEVMTACQAACPTNAIIFGDLNDPQSAVLKTRAAPHNYALLRELNTKPRTTYLAKLTNPNPELGTD